MMQNNYMRPPCHPRLAQIVNGNLHAAYAELKAILGEDLKAAGRPPAGMGLLPVAAVAAVAIGAFYYLRK